MKAAEYCRMNGIEVGDHITAVYWTGTREVLEIPDGEDFIRVRCSDGMERLCHSLTQLTKAVGAKK